MKTRAERKAYNAAWYIAHRPEELARAAEYRNTHREEIRRRDAVAYAASETKDYIVRKAYHAAYRKAHREEAKLYYPVWRKANHEQVLAYHRKYMKRVRQTERWRIQGRLEAKKRYALKRSIRDVAPERVLTRRQWERIVTLANGRCHWRISADCPNRHGKRMTKPTQDHVIPLIRGGLHVAENIVACCFACNCKKNAKVLTLF